MSDTAKCPLCNKYINTTFTLDACPKCGGDLSGQVLLTGHEPASPEPLFSARRLRGILAAVLAWLACALILIFLGTQTRYVSLISIAIGWVAYKIVANISFAPTD